MSLMPVYGMADAAKARAKPAMVPPGASFFVDGWADPAFLEQFGITRVGDLTGLDRIGIPVWFACRPNSRGLSVSQGKGLSHAQARISAVMEAVEGAIAEQTGPLIERTGSIASMRKDGYAIIPLERMQRCRASRIAEDRERSWVQGYCFSSGEAIHAPYELVGLDMRVDSPWDHHSFLMSTIGLAAGASLEQAALHGVCELIENDATTMVDLLGVRASRSRGIDCSRTAHSGLASAISLVEASGMKAGFFEVTGVIPVPVVACFIESPFHSARKEAVGIAAGFACRPFAADAALAALMEAVQSRLTKIAGSREDLSDASYRKGRSRLPEPGGESIPVDELAMTGADALRDDEPGMLRSIIRLLVSSTAADKVYLFPLHQEDPGFTVVRALIPDLETVVPEGVVKLGNHALRRLLALKEPG